MRTVMIGSILFLLVVLLAGCKVQSAAPPASGNVVTMGPNNFEQASITIQQGQTITFVDDKQTGSLHILVIGKQGKAQQEPGAPDFKGASGISVQPGQRWTSPPWNTPGTYDLTCTVHPTTMNMTVVVIGSATPTAFLLPMQPR